MNKITMEIHNFFLSEGSDDYNCVRVINAISEGKLAVQFNERLSSLKIIYNNMEISDLHECAREIYGYIEVMFVCHLRKVEYKRIEL